MTQVLVPEQTRPSWQNGFARSAAESANPNLWGGLVGAWVPAMGFTNEIVPDLSGRGAHADPNEATFNYVPSRDWTNSVDGPQFQPSKTNSVSLNSRRPVLENDENVFSLAVKFYRSGNDYGALMSKDKNGNREWFFATQTNGRLLMRLYQTDGTGRERQTATGSFPLNEWHHLVLLADGPNSVCTLYNRGVYAQDMTPVSWDGTCRQRTEDLRIGSHFDNGFCTTVDLSSAYIYNRLLTPDEIMHMHVDHLAAFQRRSLVVPFSVAAPAAGAPTGAIYGPLVGSLGGPI